MYLLSYKKAFELYKDNIQINCKTTDFCRSKGAEYDTTTNHYFCDYWTTSSAFPNYCNYSVATVKYYQFLGARNAYGSNEACRPFIRIEL